LTSVEGLLAVRTDVDQLTGTGPHGFREYDFFRISSHFRGGVNLSAAALLARNRSSNGGRARARIRGTNWYPVHGPRGLTATAMA